MFMLIVFLSILSNLSILSVPSTLSMLNTQPLSARKITTFFRYTQIFPVFCEIYLSKSFLSENYLLLSLFDRLIGF